MYLNHDLIQKVNTSGNIYLNTSHNAGRGLYAKCNIPSGQILIEEEAFVWILTSKRLDFITASETSAKIFLSSLQWKSKVPLLSSLFQLCPESRTSPDSNEIGYATKEVVKTLLRVLDKKIENEIPQSLIQAYVVRKIFDENSFVLSG